MTLFAKMPFLNKLMLIALAIAFFRGVSVPSLWGINYLIPSMLDGFYRRALGGSILYPLGDLRFNLYVLSAIQAFILLAMIREIASLVAKSQPHSKLVTTIFLLSPLGVFLFNNIGFIEQLLYLLTLIALRTSVPVGSAIMISTLWFHELAAFTVIPLYSTVRLMRHPRHFWSLVSLAGIQILSFLLIYLSFQTVPTERIIALVKKIKSVATYTIDPYYYKVFDHSFTGKRQNLYYHSAEYFEIICLGVIGLLTGSLLLRRIKATKPFLWYNLILPATIFLTCIMPLGLGFFAWDVDRWIYMSALSSGIILIHTSAHDILIRKTLLLSAWAIFAAGIVVHPINDANPIGIVAWTTAAVNAIGF